MQIFKIIRMKSECPSQLAAFTEAERSIIKNRMQAIQAETQKLEDRKAVAMQNLRKVRALAEDYNAHYIEYCDAIRGLWEEYADLNNELAKLDNDEQ
jgi:hypothetical protein